MEFYLLASLCKGCSPPTLDQKANAIEETPEERDIRMRLATVMVHIIRCRFNSAG